MNKLFSVTSIDTFFIKGRGMVFIIKSPLKINMLEHDLLSNAYGKNIIIDDREYEITRVEKRGYWWKNIEMGEEIAIIVKDGWWNE